MARLSDTRVLVTGGTSGLGRAMAQALCEAGARVAVTSRRCERAQATAEELGAGALGVELDVRDAGSVSASVDGVYGMLGGLDARRLSRRAGDQSDRDVPGRAGGGVTNAERRRRTLERRAAAPREAAAGSVTER